MRRYVLWTSGPDLPIDKLRRIKNRLTVIHVLADVPGFAPNVELAAWLGLWDGLP